MTIPVILSADNNYAGQMYVTILSILENSRDSHYYFYLTVPDDFSSENKKKLIKLITKYGAKFVFITLKDEFDGVQRTIKRISTPTYYRLLAANFIPLNFDKCIYLDVDTCVCSDLKCLFEIQLDDNYLAGVIEPPIAKPSEIRAKELNLPSCTSYINAGVLLMNLKKIRDDNLTDKFKILCKQKFPNQDQDVLNIACYGHIKTIPCKFNASPRNLFNIKSESVYSQDEIKEGKRHPIIIHYSDSQKPWNSKIEMRDIWWKYAIKAPYEFNESSCTRIRAFSTPIGTIKKIDNKKWISILGLPIFYQKRNKSEITTRFLCFRWTEKITEQDSKTQLPPTFPKQIKSIDWNLNTIKREIKNELFLDENVRVSVIMPVYNTEKFLSKSLEGILNQSFLNYEVICIDDGSTDASLNILENYQKKYANLRIIYSTNKGAGEARNIGLSHAKGEYVIFLDSDDIFDYCLINESYRKAKQCNADIVIFRAKSYLREKNLTQRAEWALNTKYLPKKDVFETSEIASHAFQIYSSCPWNKLIKTDLAKKFKFQNIRNANDVYFMYSCLLESKVIAYLDKYLITYRQGRPGGLQNTKSEHFECVFKAWNKLFELQKDNDKYYKFARSMKNKALESIIYYYNSINESSRELMHKEIKKWDEKFELSAEEEAFYYRKSDYQSLIDIIK